MHDHIAYSFTWIIFPLSKDQLIELLIHKPCLFQVPQSVCLVVLTTPASYSLPIANRSTCVHKSFTMITNSVTVVHACTYMYSCLITLFSWIGSLSTMLITVQGRPHTCSPRKELFKRTHARIMCSLVQSYRAYTVHAYTSTYMYMYLPTVQ